MKKVRALVVDDSAYNRMAISQMLESDAEVTVVGTASDGIDAIAKTLRLTPDVVTLDLEMPGMDGFTFLRWIMKEQPTPVLIISSRSDSRSVFRALELGAVDFLAKPEARISRSIEGIRDELVSKIHAVLNLEMAKVQSSIDLATREAAAPEPPATAEAEQEQGPIKVVAIASSTGGPSAIQAILSSLPRRLGSAIIISQHMPPGFTRSFAERLDKFSPLSVAEASDGDAIRPGRVLIAPGGAHVLVKRGKGGLRIELASPREDDKYVPSADRMMESAAAAAGAAVLGIVLTGMGNDGARGATIIKKRKGQVLAESEESAVIFGMPQEAIRTGMVDKVLPLGKMAEEIASRCGAAQKYGLILP